MPIPVNLPFLPLLGLTFVLQGSLAAAGTQNPETFAQDVDKTITRLVAEIELFRFSDEHLAIIKSLAYQEGVAVICPGFETDEGRRIDFLSQIVPMQDEDFRTAPLESVVLRSEVMFSFGTHFGATVAVGKADPAAFCARAERQRQDPALVARIWLPEK